MKKLAWIGLALALVSSSAIAGGPKVKVKECKCSINIPKNWFVMKYSMTEAGLEYLVTSSPDPDPQTNNVPGIQFLRQKLEPGASGSAEDFLRATTSQMQDVEVSEPSATKLDDSPAAASEVVYKTIGLHQRYIVTVHDSAVYILIISWKLEEDLKKLEDSVKSVKL